MCTPRPSLRCCAVQYVKGEVRISSWASSAFCENTDGSTHAGATLLVANRGNVTDEVWIDQMKNQAPPEPGDNFKEPPVGRTAG